MPREVGVQKKSARQRAKSASRYDSADATALHLAQGSGGYGSMGQYGIAASMAYIQTVKDSLRHKPGAYRKFVGILSEVEKPGVDILPIIDRVVALLDGHPDLIFSFNAFLPRNYEIEMQDHAVVVKVYDLHTGTTLGKTVRWESDVKGQGHKDYGESVGYIKAVKNALTHSPHKYSQFMEILADYHAHKEDQVMTVRQVVRLLQDFPRLVLGFNSFLPPEYEITLRKNGAYTIEYPGQNGRVTVKLTPQ